jgi:hypothetical protein
LSELAINDLPENFKRYIPNYIIYGKKNTNRAIGKEMIREAYSWRILSYWKGIFLVMVMSRILLVIVRQ